MLKDKPKREQKYLLYEASVQEASDDAEILESLYMRIRRKKPTVFREDFCGSFKLASEWVKRSPQHRALALDIDPEPLAFGRKYHWSALSPDEQKRLQPMRKNVLSVTHPRAHIIAACNFSYWIFKERKDLIAYFKKVHRSLRSDGVFFLDIVGGTEMCEPHKDKHKYKVGRDRFTYIWRCESFNPVKNEGFYSISFRFSNGREWKRAFTYDWRLWSLRETRECLKEAGFKSTAVYWEEEDSKGLGTGEFRQTEREENSAVWIAYVVGIK